MKKFLAIAFVSMLALTACAVQEETPAEETAPVEDVAPVEEVAPVEDAAPVEDVETPAE